MKKYFGFYWTVDSAGWRINETLEEAKDPWCFGMYIFEFDAEDEKELLDYYNEVGSNRLLIAKLKEKNCQLIHNEGHPPQCFVTK